MARNNGPLIPDEDIATRPGSPASSAADDSALDARFLDLDADEQTPFLRGQKRVPVRRGPLPKKAAGPDKDSGHCVGHRRGDWWCERGCLQLRNGLVAVPVGIERSNCHPGTRECIAPASYGSGGQRYRAQCFLHSIRRTQAPTGADSVGRVGERVEIAAEPVGAFPSRNGRRWRLCEWAPRSR